MRRCVCVCVCPFVSVSLLCLSCEAVGGSNYRMNINIFGDWATKVTMTQSLRKLWVAPRANKINMDEWATYRVDPATVESWPAGVDPEGIWLFDSAVPQLALGPGVLSLEVSVATTSTMPGAGSIGNGPSLPRTGSSSSSSVEFALR